MTDLTITPEGRQYLAEGLRQARAIATNGGAYTKSQRETAWRVLTLARRREQDAAPVVRADDGDAA